MPITLVDQNDNPIYMPIPNPNPTPSPFNITLFDNHLPYDTHNTYSITIDTTLTIQTLLTCSPIHVESWLLETQSLSPAIIGLDIEWRPNSQRGQSNPAATLQLYTNNRCLIFQLIHSPSIPTFLFTFLSNPNNRFVGVGIESDIEKIIEDYNLTVANYVDLRNLAADVLEDRDLLRSGIKTLAERVLGKIVEKPSRITRSRWDNPMLDWDQVKYATVDAFLSFEIARRLYSHQVIE
ncbi:putative DNA helicase [Medicago truncatula]|uniref:Putative DNA helicase n=1 Tax=Medicago truncatula TaxID=3880 RepID=I3T053_MEDTR|nr:Werner Syndrome-like exonuclease [Medicago truncatula]AFK45895.1 unknown [Medicago truncatula]RHN46361.1 putative DNA helicase [Medicago truncatula]